MEAGLGQDLLRGFAVALTPQNLLFCFLGVTFGTLIGVLPAIGPAGAIAILLPFTFGMEATAALILLAGIYYGGMYGGSTTSVLVNIPGETASIVTTFDGHQMARKGRAGPALAMAAIGSFIGGTFSILALTVVAVPIASFALDFGPPEYAALATLGLFAAAYLSGRSLLKGVAIAVVGLMLATVGIDLITGGSRFTFGRMELYGGIEIIPIIMGVFGVSEIMLTLEQPFKKEILGIKIRLRDLVPSRQEIGDSVAPVARGSLLGFVIGILPGAGSVVSSFLSYAMEKKLSKHPERFGTGMIQGVVGPETANNSATGGAMIPLMVLGVPYSVMTALMLSALIMHGLHPSPSLMSREPEFFWGVVASMYIGNIMCLILNLPMIGIWVRLLTIPYAKLGPLIVLFAMVGVYSINSRLWDLWIMVVSGILGYLLRKAEYSVAPLALAIVLGPILENAVRQSLLISKGNPLIFFTRPISGTLMAVSMLILFMPIFQWGWRRLRPREAQAEAGILDDLRSG